MNRIFKVTRENNDYTKLEVIDLYNESHFMIVKSEDYDAYLRGDLIQKCFPYLSVDDRELILTGMTPEMWDTINGEEE